MNLRQIAVFVGIVEEGSFNKAAQRLNATQSGLSMQIRNLEDDLGIALFDRSPRGATLTTAGRLFHARAVMILRQVDEARTELRDLAGEIRGPLRVGLMPTFTRGLLAPVLDAYLTTYPGVTMSVVEAYSARLTRMVAEGAADFAIVPQARPDPGLAASYLGTDREILVSRTGRFRHLSAVRLADLPPLKLVLPAPGNARRDAIDRFIADTGLRVAALVDMDAMITTLELVARSDYVTILPATICTDDLDGTHRCLNPIVDPPMTVNYSVIEPAARALPPAAGMLLHRIREAYAESDRRWRDVLE